MFKQIVTAFTAVLDTTETLIDTVTVPDGVSKLVGVASIPCAAATLTSGEPCVGKVSLKSDDRGLEPCQFLTDCVNVLTNGAASLKPTQWPCLIPVAPGNRIKVYGAYASAQTGAVAMAVQLTFE